EKAPRRAGERAEEERCEWAWASHGVGKEHRPCRPASRRRRLLRAAFGAEQIGHLASLQPHRRAERALALVAPRVDRGAVREEEPDEIGPAELGGDVERREALVLADVGVRALVEEELHRLRLAAEEAGLERGVVELVPGALVEDGALREEELRHLGLAAER